MMRFFTQMHPKILPVTGTPSYPGCLSFVKGNLVPLDPVRKVSDKSDKPQQKGQKAREEKELVQMPGFVHPHSMDEEGCFTQKAKQQIEELKKKKEKPSLRNPEGKE